MNLKKKQKLGEKPDNDDNPPKKWRKCQYCLCDCQPKWKKCECPCSQHPHWKCPKKQKNDDKEKNEKKPEKTLCSSAASSSNLNNLYGFLQGKSKEISSVKPKAKDQDTVMISHQLTLLASNKNTQLSSSAYGTRQQLTVDSACPTTMVGAPYFKKIYQSYPEAVSSQFESEPSTKTFQFGGGETTHSLGK